MKFEVHHAKSSQIDTHVLYDILQLRSAVLVVEQHAPYPDLDGLDLEEGTAHLWATSGADIIGCARLLDEGEGAVRLGRLCTAHHARGRGVARLLVLRALDLAGDGVVETNTHSNLVPWYESFGFKVAGQSFNEVGIPHTPMRKS